jgi:hypothetical protein
MHYTRVALQTPAQPDLPVLTEQQVLTVLQALRVPMVPQALPDPVEEQQAQQALRVVLVQQALPEQLVLQVLQAQPEPQA